MTSKTADADWIHQIDIAFGSSDIQPDSQTALLEYEADRLRGLKRSGVGRTLFQEAHGKPVFAGTDFRKDIARRWKANTNKLAANRSIQRLLKKAAIGAFRGWRSTFS